MKGLAQYRVTLREDARIVGGLSNPSKMPGHSYSTPIAKCGIGTILRAVKGSTCESCYVDGGHYNRRSAQVAMWRRYGRVYRALHDPKYARAWVRSMARLVRAYSSADGAWRWHDSGDVLSARHLQLIARVARLTPEIRHWLPTREYRVIGNYPGALPANLVVRISAAMVNGNAPNLGFPMSTVHSSADAPAGARVCPAPKQNGECGDCRACWNPEVKIVSYHIH